MAQIIDTVAIRVDADTSLFDKKLKTIKDELKKIQKINIDINRQNKGAGGGGLSALGAAGIGVAGGAAAGAGIGASGGAGLALVAEKNKAALNSLRDSFNKLNVASTDNVAVWKSASNGIMKLKGASKKLGKVTAETATKMSKLGDTIRNKTAAAIGKLRAVMAGFRAAMAKLKPVASVVGSGISSIFKGMAGVVGGALKRIWKVGKWVFKKLKMAALVAFAAISLAAKKGFTIGMEDKRAYANVDAALAATGKQIGLTAEQVKGFADELDRTTNFDGADLANAAGILATFVNIKSDKFKDVLTTATDLSAAFGQDLKSSTVQLGKALNDPIRGVTALSRVGVSFTKAEREKVKALMESNDLLGAQELIMRSIKSQGIQGQAFAQADSVNQAKKGFEDLQVAVSSFIVKFFRLKPLFDNARGWFDSISARINEFTKTKQFADWSARIIYAFQMVYNVSRIVFGNLIVLWKHLANVFGAVFDFIEKHIIRLSTVAEFAVYVSGLLSGGFEQAEKALDDYIRTKNRLDSELKQKLQFQDVFEDIDVKGALPVIANEMDDITDATDNATDATDNATEKFEELARTINQSTGATSIFDSVLDSVNALASGTATLGMRMLADEPHKLFNNLRKMLYPDFIEMERMATGGSGSVGSVSNATAGSGAPSIYSQLINAIQTQTDVLVNSLDKIDKSVKEISIVI